MKKLIYSLLAIASLGITACEKDAVTLIGDANSSVAFIYAAPAAPTADIVIDGLVSNGSRRLTYDLRTSLGGGGGNGGAYIPLLNGSRNIKISTDSGRTSLVDANWAFLANKSYTVAVYDTLPISGTQTLRSVQLTDDLTPPTGTNVHVRFLHLAPLAPAVDLTLLRTAPALDSVTLTNRTYLGATPNATTLSTFAPIPGGTAYTLRVKLAGTQTVVATFNLGTNLSAGRIVTLAAIGTARGASLNAMALRHY
jgi:hypothetical protein